MSEFVNLVYTPAGLDDPSLAICASRAGGVGILNAELSSDARAILGGLDRLGRYACGPYGIKIGSCTEKLSAGILRHVRHGLSWLIVDAPALQGLQPLLRKLRAVGVRVL